MNVSLIIPAYNEEKRIGAFLESIAIFVERNPGVLQEVLVVDDGSKDTTAAVAQESGKILPNFHLISLQQNVGKGGAIRAGVLAATGDIIVFMDADGATSIDEMPRMLRALETSDIAIGNRWMKGAQSKRHSIIRQLSGFAYRNYMKLFGLGDIDTMCGFKGYKKDMAKELYGDLQEMRWLFDTEIAYRALYRKYRIRNFPIVWESKDGSKLDTGTLIKSALQILPLIIKIRREEKGLSPAV